LEGGEEKKKGVSPNSHSRLAWQLRSLFIADSRKKPFHCVHVYCVHVFR
jgi:hypothetical protein